jgi:integrase/recombinase XerD
MTALRRKMIEDMELRGLSESTKKLYVRAVRDLCKYWNKSPDLITQEELRGFLLYFQREKKAAPSTCSVTMYGIKFFYRYTLKRNWPILDWVRPVKEQKLPVVLSVDEVHTLLSSLKRLRHRARLGIIYACGLRVQEGVSLQVTDIDSDRMVVHIRQGKGRKDRYVPLPEPMLEILREYWLTHRNPVWLFPSPIPYGTDLADAKTHISARSVQDVFRAALKKSGIKKPATVHSLRHSFATHLLQAGVSLPVIQAYLGHSRLSSTAIYIHLTQEVEAPAKDAMHQLMDAMWV